MALRLLDLRRRIRQLSFSEVAIEKYSSRRRGGAENAETFHGFLRSSASPR